MDAFDTQILLGPHHVKAIKKVNCMCRIFSFNYLLYIIIVTNTSVLHDPVFSKFALKRLCGLKERKIHKASNKHNFL